MLKISHAADSHQEVRLRLEGQVSGPWVEELRRACDEATGGDVHRAERLVLDMTDVLFIDANGVALFRRLIASHVMLKNCSPFVAEQLKEGSR